MGVTSTPTRVLIIGGGFAGVACAMRLADEPDVDVTLVDRNGYNQFQPLLYQVATAELTAQDIRFDLTDMFGGHENIAVRGSAVVSIDPDEKTVTLASGEVLHGDVIVLAAGTKPNFFRVAGAQDQAFPLYSVADAERVRTRVLQLFADASAKPELVDSGALTFVWGGGVSAAEVAANSGVVQGRGGRIAVRPDLTVPGFDHVYAIGDVAAIPFGDEAALPQLASVAQQSGDWAAQNILADAEGLPRSPFHYKDKGILAMIGRKAAVAEIGEHRHELHGRVAFAAWPGVHAHLLANLGAEVDAFLTWAEEFYVRPHHRSAELLDPSTLDTPRIKLNRRNR